MAKNDRGQGRRRGTQQRPNREGNSLADKVGRKRGERRGSEKRTAGRGNQGSARIHNSRREGRDHRTHGRWALLLLLLLLHFPFNRLLPRVIPVLSLPWTARASCDAPLTTFHAFFILKGLMSRYTVIPPTVPQPPTFFLDDVALFSLLGSRAGTLGIDHSVVTCIVKVLRWQVGKRGVLLRNPYFSSARLKHKTLVSDSSRPYDQLPGQFRVPSTVIRSPRHGGGKTVPLLRGSYHHSDVA